MAPAPRVLHFNDCAGVGAALVRAAGRQGLAWDHLLPGQVRPQVPPAALRGVGRLRYVPFVARRARVLRRTDVVHVHYATSVRLLRERGMPRRPYFLHLHGTDIRTQWHDPHYRPEIERAIGEAEGVYFTTPDLAANALAARADAGYMPAFVEPAELPAWSPTGRPRIVFVSRWSADKGLPAQLDLAAALAAAVGPRAELVGLDWGPGAPEARRRGVRLVPRLPHAGYLDLLATAHVTVGQATAALGVSELEAMAIGAPLASPGEHLEAPGQGPAPILEGTIPAVVEQVLAALEDPARTARELGSAAWVRAHHVADPYVPALEERYRAAAAAG